MTELQIYQSSDNKWIVFSNSIKSDYFILEEDAKNMATKITFANQAQIETTSLAQIADRLANLETVYFDRGYNSGGSNPILDDDITSLDFTAVDLASLITLIQQLNNFLSNSAVVSGDYDVTLNAIRNDV